MVNRELIRAKVLQLVYAFYMGGDKPVDIALRELEASLAKANDLYYHLLSLIVAVTREESLRHEVLLQKAVREKTPPPSTRFIDNRFARQLEENKTLRKFEESRRLVWKDDIDYVRRLCDVIEQTDIYADYLAAEEDDYEADREVWRKLYKQIITVDDDLDDLLEEQSLYWNDDKEIVDTFVLKTIKRFEPETGAEQELLPDYKDPLDRKFALQLLSVTIDGETEFRQYIERASENWDLSRMPFIDIIIMQIAIAEIITFPEIPISVTINEYIELSKSYSTPKSATFINAMLDSIARALIDDGKVAKQMTQEV